MYDFGGVSTRRSRGSTEVLDDLPMEADVDEYADGAVVELAYPESQDSIGDKNSRAEQGFGTENDSTEIAADDAVVSVSAPESAVRAPDMFSLSTGTDSGSVSLQLERCVFDSSGCAGPES